MANAFEYTEERVVARLKKAGVQFSGGRVMKVPGNLGIKLLGMVDYLQRMHKYFPKFAVQQ